MLDITTNPINCISSSGSATNNSSNDDMDPLFDNDWLHEHNLDILFDLFEEEMESKSSLDSSNNNSSTIFGSSPVTSYLFGTSPSLASALDLYDLLYFDSQQPTTTTINNSAQQHQSQASTNNSSTNNATTTATTNSNTNIQANTTTYNINNNSTITSNNSNCAPKSQHFSTNHIANSITNAIRIKRRLKRGQNEGISLLARPNLGNNSCSSSSSSSSCSSNSSSTSSNSINNNYGDKTSTKITNLKKTIISKSPNNGAININNAKQSHHNCNKHLHYHHVHYLKSCAIIREHAYAVRGH